MKNSQSKKKELSAKQSEILFGILKARFEKHASRHKGIEWTKVQAKLKAAPERVWSLQQMEDTGGEPDVIGYDKKQNEYLFVDCSPESPVDRRSVCYDPEALASRKEHKPKHSAVGMAVQMGIELLTEEQYRELQQKGDFDLKTSSWLAVPAEIRKLGGGIFGDKRYGRVFVYHNGVESYYASRGFRGLLRV